MLPSSTIGSALLMHTESRFDEGTGAFVEVGNELTPPDPDKPIIAKESPLADEAGSW